MAKHLIFNSDGYLVKIASDDAEKDNITNYSETAVSCSDTEFDDVQKRKKTAAYNNGSVSYSDLDEAMSIEVDDVELARPEGERLSSYQADNVQFIKDNLNTYINAIENWLKSNTDTEWTSYLNSLKNIDQNSISAPTSKMTFEEWLLSQPSFPQKTLLHLKI
tara:strand:+ start:150 stop:638 length:489 start_codon:yes stop_codon:yes gene_type:complete